MALKRIGLVIPEMADPLDFELLRGIYSQAAALEADVIVLSGVLNPSADDLFDSYTVGFSNIYQLICTANVDGFLFAADRFRDAAYRDGFECIGYPDEVVKYLTDDEYQRLLQQFQSKTDASGSSVKHRGIMPR